MASANARENPFVALSPGDSEPRQVYKLMTGIIVPRPVALISTVDSDGVANPAPFSFFTGVGAIPPPLLFCPTVRTRGEGAETEGEARLDAHPHGRIR